MSKVTETWNGRRQFPKRGRYFELLTTVNPVDIEFYARDGTLLYTADQVEQGFWVDRRETAWFDYFEIITGASEEVSFLVTDGTAGNRSVPADITNRAARLLGIVYGSLGHLVQQAVNSVNALVVKVASAFNDAVTDANEAFAGVATLGASGGNYGHAQLKNPAASGKVVYVDSFKVTSAAGDQLRYGHYDTDLTTDVAAGYSKKNGGADASAHIRSQVNGSILMTKLLGVDHQPSGECITVELDPPVRLDAGDGFVVANNTVNTALQVSFNFREVTA